MNLSPDYLIERKKIEYGFFGFKFGKKKMKSHIDILPLAVCLTFCNLGS